MYFHILSILQEDASKSQIPCAISPSSLKFTTASIEVYHRHLFDSRSFGSLNLMLIYGLTKQTRTSARGTYNSASWTSQLAGHDAMNPGTEVPFTWQHWMDLHSTACCSRRFGNRPPVTFWCSQVWARGCAMKPLTTGTADKRKRTCYLGAVGERGNRV